MGQLMGTSEELAGILEQHRRWLNSGRKSGKCADLSGANLNGVDFTGVDLSGAAMHGVSLDGANLSAARLVHTDLRDASPVGRWRN